MLIFLSIAIGIYLVLVVVLKSKYSRLYFWNKDCIIEEIATNLIQPIMELIGNSMTAHNWHFQRLDNPNSTEIHSKITCIRSNTKPIRKFDSGFVKMILTSAFVDVNPLQQCAILRPKSYTYKWKIAFPTDLSKDEFKIEKCSHFGAVKIVIDGSGCNFGIGEKGEIIELEVVEICKAYQRKDILFV
jgi:hypothetical protein